MGKNYLVKFIKDDVLKDVCLTRGNFKNSLQPGSSLFYMLDIINLFDATIYNI